MAAAGRDCDEFDAICDHLLVIDHSRPAEEAVVGTYRLLRQDVAERHGGFYSAGEYDLSTLVEGYRGPGNLLEVGRSCVHRDYRTQSTIHRLWRALSDYVAEHRIAYMFGCASLPGVEPEALAVPVSYLHHNHLAPAELRVRALAQRYVDMNMLPADDPGVAAAWPGLPPLIKGYLRLGAFVGEGAVVDPQFGTTDVFILLPIGRVAGRYIDHFDYTGPFASA